VNALMKTRLTGVRQLSQQILKAGITNEGSLMSLLLAPDSNGLGHDTGKLAFIMRAYKARVGPLETISIIPTSAVS